MKTFASDVLRLAGLAGLTVAPFLNLVSPEMVVGSAILQNLAASGAYELIGTGASALRRRFFNTLAEPNHHLNKALRQAILQALKDIDLEDEFREIYPPGSFDNGGGHAVLEEFFSALRKGGPCLVLPNADNAALVQFLEDGTQANFEALAGTYPAASFPGLPPEVPEFIFRRLHAATAARFWDLVKNDAPTWHAYSAQIFTQLRESLSDIGNKQDKIFESLKNREEEIKFHFPADIYLTIENRQRRLFQDIGTLKKKLDVIIASLERIEGRLTISKSRLRTHLLEASEKALERDLAEASAIQGDWMKRQKLSDAAHAAHARRISRVEALVDEFVTLEAGINASDTLTEMFRILDEEGFDSALIYLQTQSSRILQSVLAQLDSARASLQPLLAGARLAIANGKPDKAESLFLLLLRPDLPEWPEARKEYIEFLLLTKGWRAQERGDVTNAREAYKEAERQVRIQILRDDDNAQWKYLLEISQHKLGDIALEQGELLEAKKHFKVACEITESLVADAPKDVRWQRSLSIVYGKFGTIAKYQGDLSKAIHCWSIALRIARKQAIKNKDDVDLEFDLSCCQANLGNLYFENGGIERAKFAYSESNKILRNLVRIDSRNKEYQCDLATSYESLGTVACAKGDIRKANSAYSAQNAIIKELLLNDSECIRWQTELSRSYIKLGDIALAKNDVVAAKNCYAASHEIRLNLVNAEPENNQFQKDLSFSYYKLATLEEHSGNLTEGNELFRKSYEIVKAFNLADKKVSPAQDKFMDLLKSKL